MRSSERQVSVSLFVCKDLYILAVADLTQGLVQDNADAVGEIEAANGAVWHWDGQAVVAVLVEEVCGQAAGFGAEYEAVGFKVLPVGIGPRGFCCYVL
jgi:hypothetical protein